MDKFESNLAKFESNMTKFETGLGKASAVAKDVAAVFTVIALLGRLSDRIKARKTK